MKQEEISLRTRKKLADSLKQEMKKKPFSKITVKDITDGCNLNRNTFYYHFEDIYELLRWMFDEEAVKIVQNFDLLEDYKDAISFIIDYVEKNDHIISCTLDSISRKELKRFFYNDFFSITASVLSDAQKQQHISLDPDYELFLTKLFTESLVGMLIDWITSRENIPRDQFISYLHHTIRDSLNGIFASGHYSKIESCPEDTGTMEHFPVKPQKG